MPQVVEFDEYGGPEVLHLIDEPVVEPGPGEVRVKIEAFAVNPLDLMTRAGTPPMTAQLPHARLGVEGAGVVDAVGPDVTTPAVGDAVVFAAVPDATVRGTYAEYTTVPASRVISRPPGLAVDEAAAVWVGFSTAYGALVEKAGMGAGDVVLITAPAGSVGRAAIQIAARVGAVPIAVTRRSARIDELLAAGAAAVVSTDREDLVDAVLAHTGGRGADVVLDLVRGPGQEQLAAATRQGGTIVAAGFLDPHPVAPVATDVRVIDYASFEHTTDPAAVARMAAFLNAGVVEGTLRPLIDRTYPLREIVAAHQRVEEGANAGRKVVVTVSAP